MTVPLIDSALNRVGAVAADSREGTAWADRGCEGGRRGQHFHVEAMWYTARMVKTLEQAIAEVAALPDADQEQIGRKLLSHVEKLRRLREELDKGVRSLDAGKGMEFSIEEFIREKSA